MNLRRLFAGLLLCLSLTALTAFAQSVSTDYDHSVDFSKYKTYAWIHPPNVTDELMRQRVEDAVNQQLQAKGLRMVASAENADLGVVVNGATQEKHTLQTFYDGFPGDWRWGGLGTATTTESTYDVGTLIVDLFDTASHRIIWRGVGTETLSEKPAKNEKKIERVTEKMFEHFPKRLT